RSGVRRRRGRPGQGAGRGDRMRRLSPPVPPAPDEVPLRRFGQHVRHHPRAGEGPGREVQGPQPLPAHRQDARRGRVRPAGQPDRHAGARASEPPGRRGEQARLEREANGQLARRRAEDPGGGPDEGGADLGAPAMVVSPQFAFMAKAVAAGKLGKPAAAPAEDGHSGRDWAGFFYERGGGSLPALAVYNLTTLTGVLGPAKAVTAMTSVVTPTRKIRGKGEIKVVAEDNAMVL